jgi:hypothetical protein
MITSVAGRKASPARQILPSHGPLEQRKLPKSSERNRAGEKLLFSAILAAKKLAHTWHGLGAPGAATTVTYLLEPCDGGTRVTLRHSGIVATEMCTNICVGWETSFERLAEWERSACRAPDRGLRRKDGRTRATGPHRAGGPGRKDDDGRNMLHDRRQHVLRRHRLSRHGPGRTRGIPADAD